MTVTGTGFDPQNSAVLVCGSTCAVDKLGSDSTTLLCETPLNNGKYSKKKKRLMATFEECNFWYNYSLFSFLQLFNSFDVIESDL